VWRAANIADRQGDWRPDKAVEAALAEPVRRCNGIADTVWVLEEVEGARGRLRE